MKYLIRLCLYALVLFSAAAPLFCEPVFDWGGYLSSTGKVSDLHSFDAVNAELEAATGLWLRADFSEKFGLYGRASYSYSEEQPVFADIDSLYAQGRFLFIENGQQTLLRYSAGRFRFADFTGYVLNHALDGFRLNYEHPVFSLEAGAGYSGLTFVPNSSILVSQSDYYIVQDAPDHGYALAPSRIIETFKMTFPSILDSQELIINALLQQDVQREEDLVNEDDRIHTEYLGLGIRGALYSNLYHNLFFYFNYGHGKYSTTAVLFGGGISFYNEDLLYSRVSLRGMYASGDNELNFYYGGYGGNENSKHFIALSASPQLAAVFSPQIGNISLAELSFSMRPFLKTDSLSLEKLQTSLILLAFFRNTGGAVSEAGVDYTSDESYLGSELDLALRYRPFSDLAVSLSGGFFIPNAEVFEAAQEDLRSAIRLDLSFSY